MSNLTENKLNTVISDADVLSIATSITSIVNKLPSGSLTDEQRQTLKGIDVNNKIFVEDVISELGISASGIVPPFINAASIQTDLILYEQLDIIAANLSNVLQKVSDLKRIAGDEAYSMALAAYKIYDGANQFGIAGAKQSYDNLKTRFDAQNGGGRKPDPAI